MNLDADYYLGLLKEKGSDPDPVTTARIKTIFAISNLFEEICNNPDTPPKIVELAEEYKQAIITQTKLMNELLADIEKDRSI